MPWAERWIPGLARFRQYDRAWLRDDVVAGLSVSAVAVPIAIAYAQIAGVPPNVAIYSAIFAPLAYAVFGTSRHLVLNPDSVTCAILASTLAPLAVAGSQRYLDLSVAIAMLVGVLGMIGGLLRLGVVANFLARPILTGYMNGIAATILVGQLAPLTGLQLEAQRFLGRIWELGSHVAEVHVPTILLGVSLLVLLRLLKRFVTAVPGPLVASIVAIVVTALLGLDGLGVDVVGAVPAGFTFPRIPRLSAEDFPQLLAGACTITVVAYCSMVPAARAYALKHGYDVDDNQEFIALGAANLASGFGQGFAVSGADSRTAVADAAGAKSQMAGIVAAVAIALVLLFLTGPLALLPRAALAAIVIAAVVGMFDLKAPLAYYRVNPIEGIVSVVTTIGVIGLGLLPGLLIALGLAFLRLLMLVSHPHDAVLGLVETEAGAYATEAPEGRRVPGLLIYRFNAALLFYNADYFKQRLQAVVNAEETRVEWVLLDAESMPLLDITGAATLEDLHRALADRGIVLAIARAGGPLFRRTLERTGLLRTIGPSRVFKTLSAGVDAFRRRAEAVSVDVSG